MTNLALFATLLGLVLVESKITTRINATGAIDTFLISNCDECT
jgi:hypothetical protein